MKLRNELGAIKVTTGMFFTPGGDSTQEHGVPADIRIPSPYMSKEFSESALDYPLPKKSLPAFLSPEANELTSNPHFKPVTPSVVAELQKSSKARVSKDAEFAKIETEAKEAEKKGGIVKLADMMKKTQESNKEKAKKASKKPKDGTDPDYLIQPQIKEAANVLADMILLDRGVMIANTAEGTKSEKPTLKQ
jgi:carboxyl-terminal processing protease